jgi:GNAT superfamily N-acetyltransferase
MLISTYSPYVLLDEQLRTKCGQRYAAIRWQKLTMYRKLSFYAATIYYYNAVFHSKLDVSGLVFMAKMNRNGWKIRDAKPTDHDEILSLTLSSYVQYQPQMKGMWDLYKENIIQTLADVRDAIAEGNAAEQILVETTDSGKIIGSVVLFPARSPLHDSNHDEKTPKVRLLAVLPSARGQGVATALMLECIHRSRKTGAESILLRTIDMMDVAIQMYQRMGFERDPTMDGTVSSGDTLKAFRLNLLNT